MGRENRTDAIRGISRRRLLAGLCTGAVATATVGDRAVATERRSQNAPEPGKRITNARRIGTRDVSDYDYKALWSYRKRKSLEVLLSDARVNEVARDWIGAFEAYDPLTNHLDSISVQGTTDMSAEGTVASGTFDVTANDRQVAYGLVDRRTDELVALQLTEPEDVTWERSFGGQPGRRRHEFVLSKERVWQHLANREWYPLVKVAESITGYADYPHGAVTPTAYFFKDDGKLSVLSAFLDVRNPDDPKLLDVTVVDRFVEHPAQEIARSITPNGGTRLGRIPEIPEDKRPQITGVRGYHNIEQVSRTIDRAGWNVEWTPPTTQGAEVAAGFNGKPVFAKVAPYVTFTGYDLPRRNGRSTAEWLFPNDEPVFSGELLYWDIHSQSFGGPGVLSLTSYPKTGRRPEGFRFRTHFHTGALPNAVDFHSGHRFGPYNYHISYEFYGDGVFRPVWQRQGPGYVTEFMFERERKNDGPVQFYVSAWAIDVTPGTANGVRTRVFDGQEWTTPESEFYLQGNEHSVVQFSNPNGSETVSIPLDETKEMVVVRKRAGEIGEATRVENMDAELAFYHPAQYVSGDPIQGERVYAWLLLEAPTYELPHSAGVTTYSAFGDIGLQGY
ncbi:MULTISPECIES: hypothetical protein [Halorussus]|uniref:hypothetical protein n=1 Tax=Halorussus TaxID=1070314 RepID=UPI00209D70B9|nr:hypothetical protein [Halorussus vallis]USZ73801.1 hypothetical protein NGM07_10045 [Halorussus vallis]